MKFSCFFGTGYDEIIIIIIIVSNSRNVYNTITENLQKYTDLKEELTRTWQLNAV